MEKQMNWVVLGILMVALIFVAVYAVGVKKKEDHTINRLMDRMDHMEQKAKKEVEQVKKAGRTLMK